MNQSHNLSRSERQRIYRRRRWAVGAASIVAIFAIVLAISNIFGGGGGTRIIDSGSYRAIWSLHIPKFQVDTTSTTIDPGKLPQTKVLPQPNGPMFNQGVQDLWNAIVSDNPSQALPFFFPLSAYIQVKGIADPVHDYNTRLIPAYYADIEALHAKLGNQADQAKFISFNVPTSQAQWILPGVEYNKGSYWRVYGNTLDYSINGVTHQFPIFSLISWRGEWYVVHVGPPTA